MAVILFGTQQAQQQKGQQDSEVSYAEFVEKATGMLSLRGQHLVAQNGIQIKARSFLEGVLNDDITLTPCTRYQDEGNGAGAFVSPLTRARNIGWSFGNAFISVNTIIGLLNPGFQLPEYRAVRTCPVGRGQVNDEMWVVGPWAERGEFKLYAADADGNIEPLQSWIERKLKALQSVN
jgi:hypothetical protein